MTVDVTNPSKISEHDKEEWLKILTFIKPRGLHKEAVEQKRLRFWQGYWMTGEVRWLNMLSAMEYLILTNKRLT